MANLKCPKCGSVALGATKTKVQTTTYYKAHLRLKCLNCGAEFDLVDVK